MMGFAVALPILRSSTIWHYALRRMGRATAKPITCVARRPRSTAMSLREVAAVTGVGETQYMRGTDRTPLSFQLEASLRAIEDAGLKPTDIDGVIPYGQGGAVAEDFITNFGIPDLR